MTPADTEKSGASLGELVGELTRETSALVRQELRLAGVEMRQKAQAAGRDLVVAALGGAVATGGVTVLVAALAIGLSAWIPIWMAALLAGSVALLAGLALASSALAALKRLDPMPRETVEELHENKAWLKEQF